MLLMTMSSPARKSTFPPVDCTMTPALTVMLSVCAGLLSAVVCVRVPSLVHVNA